MNNVFKNLCMIYKREYFFDLGCVKMSINEIVKEFSHM